MGEIRLENVSVTAANGIVEQTSIAIETDRIAGIGTSGRASEIVDCRGLTAMPGFIDVHIHGAVGVDVNAADVDGLMEVARFLAGHGVTAWLPTLVPDSAENYLSVITAVDQLMITQVGEPVAQAVGVHYEGVFANEKMCGALRPRFFKSFSRNELSDLPRLSRGVHMTTFAPEIDGGIELAAELKRSGWVASIGHTRADIETLDRAFKAGAEHVTHFFNAMTGMHHRDVGVVGWALANRDVTFDLIADGVHVHPTMLEFACRAKSPELVTLISDSVAPTGLGDGKYSVWGESIRVENGRTQNERGSIAGSVITMLDAVRRMRALGFSDGEVSMMGSRNPARLLGLESDCGSIDVGKRADLVLLDEAGDIRLTLVGGQIASNNL